MQLTLSHPEIEPALKKKPTDLVQNIHSGERNRKWMFRYEPSDGVKVKSQRALAVFRDSPGVVVSVKSSQPHQN